MEAYLSLAERLRTLQSAQTALTACILKILVDKGLVTEDELRTCLREASSKLSVSDVGVEAAAQVSDVIALLEDLTKGR